MMASASSWFASPSSLGFWEWVEGASILIVAIGVWGEYWAEHGKLTDHPNAILPIEFKRKKWRKFFWRALLLGLAVEFVGFGFAVIISGNQIAKLNRDAADARLETAKLELQIEQIKPENRPIKTISAYARILVKGDKYVRRKLPNDNWHAGIGFLIGTNIGQSFFGLSATESDIDIVNILGNRTDREYDISFHQRHPSGGVPSDPGMGKPASSFNDVGSFILSMPQIDSLDVPEAEREHVSIVGTNTEVLSGSVIVTLNSSLTWVFDIPPQKQRYGFISSQKTTNADNHVEAKVLPFGVADWTYPSRITNGFFNGK